ncbi:MAG: c-type cytochrome [Ginsengibacter sp.]
MKKGYQYGFFLSTIFCVVVIGFACVEKQKKETSDSLVSGKQNPFFVDTTKIPKGAYGEVVKYGRELVLHTAYYIGPNGTNGQYTGNKMNCANCHQDGGLKPYSFNLETSFRNYPQYRAREGKVLSLAERINNCIMHPHLGVKPLPLDGKEMIAILSYLKWISDSSHVDSNTPGVKNENIPFPDVAASSKRGEQLYAINCTRCHGTEGQGIMQNDSSTYIYPPLWGMKAYQPGSSMHRVIKLARWLISNMPYDKATHDKPFLTPQQAFDLAAFINDDSIHQRPFVKELNYPHFEDKAIDYDRGPFNDTFPSSQHKYGPFKPIIAYWKSKGLTPSY